MEKKQRKYPIAPSRQNKRHIAFHCDIEIVKDLRKLGYETGKIYQELLTEAVVDLLEKYKAGIENHVESSHKEKE